MTAADVKTLGDLVKIGQAILDCGRCEGPAAEALEAIAAEPVAENHYGAVVLLIALLAIERHHADARHHQQWLTVADAVIRFVRLDLERLKSDLAAAEGDQ